MAPNYSSLHQQLIAAIIAAAPKPLSDARRAFITAYYAASTVADLKAIEPKRAAGIAIACETFFAMRATRGPKVQVATSYVTERGRKLSRTQIFILNDDMPFLVDSLSALFTSLGLTIHLVLHPVLAAPRDAKGKRVQSTKKAPLESLMYVELSPLPAAMDSAALTQKILHALTHVTAAVADWEAMQSHVRSLAKTFRGPTNGASKTELQEIRDLLQWLTDNHFVFLGLGEYRAKGKMLTLDTRSARGLYRLESTAITQPIERGAGATTTEMMSVLKASESSLVHRHVPMDFIVLRRFDAHGKYIGETRILGLFTSTVYYRETQNIPFLRHKTANILRLAGFDPAGHSGKTLKTILEFLPRDELFQTDEERLFQTAMGVLSLEAKPQVKLFVRRDPFERFVSAMVYIPRERFSSSLREEISRMLERAYAGHSSTFYTQVTDSPLARVHLLIETTPRHIPDVDEPMLEQQIASRANLWSDALRDAIIATLGDDAGEPIAQTFATAFPPAYINTHSAQSAAHDSKRVLECLRGDGVALELFRAEGAPTDQLHLVCFTRDLNSELSAIIPSLEHMGCTVVDATPHIITPLPPLAPVLLRNFTLRVADAATLDLAQHKARIKEALHQIWRGRVDNDALNALVFSAGLAAWDVEILRAYSRYLQQLNFPYSQKLIATALANHGALAAQLVALFHARFDPAAREREARVAACRQAIEAALESVSNLGEDRIIRRFLALMLATLRTNFYQRGADGLPKPYFSLKFRSSEIPEMPLPVPYAEIFVTSLRMEGIHLRGGPVARGGLRWSDRPEDFRTEVLGLMKTQMVKNAVIVPQGAKGGFILRQPPVEREALQAEGVACYQMFLRGLLDITDNIVNKKVTPPSQTVRYDADDPYLVVAADKGTASFSDIANGISAEYGFWLSDAFASGGSVGYDHKEMAITARGGWVSVERHFREMGRDIARETFTAVGIGDMSGDVFGNGALLSEKMRLVAAFNHRHIFLDPRPDAATSFAERTRLFHLPRSGWNDYNVKQISKGGGVFERSAKSIALTAEVRAALGTDVTKATPDELIKIILRAPVDLLWNGGIGTYVKASTETHEQVGDRANNAVRMNGAELRCKIVGEGGNLGFTQRGRIEYARSGGRINTDAIDNSGGVDCSDHEVNIKIALGTSIAAKRISLMQRNALLKRMTDDVARLVLTDNRLQTQAVSIAQMQGEALIEPAAQLMQQLEADQFLNRAVEALPDAKQLAELRAAKQGLTRPEIAVLLAYAKMDVFRKLSTSALLDAAYFEADLLRYFPKAMQKDFAGAIGSHPLRREIVATMITNSIVNRTGFSFAHGLMQATGLPAADIAQAYIATRDAFGIRDLWASIEALDGKISAALQAQLFAEVNRFIAHQSRWFLQHVPQPMAMEATVRRYASGIAQIETSIDRLMTETLRKAHAQTVETLAAQQVPDTLARRIANLEIMASACDIIDIAAQSKQPLIAVGTLYFELGARLRLGWLRRSALALAAENHWQQLAVQSQVAELYQVQRQLCLKVIGPRGRMQGDVAEAWSKRMVDPLARYEAFIRTLRTESQFDYPMLIVALRHVQGIVAD